MDRTSRQFRGMTQSLRRRRGPVPEGRLDRGSPHADRVPAVLSSDSTQVRPQSFAQRTVDATTPVFGAEANVEKRAGVRMAHRCQVVSLCRPSGASGVLITDQPIPPINWWATFGSSLRDFNESPSCPAPEGHTILAQQFIAG